MPLFQYTSRFEPMSNHELRGVPLVGGHRSSAIQGTNPLPALLAKERAGKLVLFPPKLQPLPAPEPYRRFRASKRGKRVRPPGGGRVF